MNPYRKFIYWATPDALRNKHPLARFLVLALMFWLALTTVFYVVENFIDGFWEREGLWEINLVWDVFAIADIYLIWLLRRHPARGLVLSLAFMFVEIYVNNLFHAPINELTFGFYDWYQIAEVILAVVLLFAMPILLLLISYRKFLQ
jgi:hypothetical protein